MFKEFDEMKNSHSNEELYAIYMCDIIRMLVDIYHSSSTPVQKDVPAVIKFLLDYINENIEKKITLDTLSEASNFSKSYICNSFKFYMKTPLIQYVRTKKILAAHQLIENGSKPWF